jgi:anti-sigma factor RsiW
MKPLKETEIIDYLDGTLSPTRMAEVEAHLRENAEDAELVASLKMAKSELLEWDAAEPVQVSADFWPKLRDKLPAQAPRRAWWKQLGAALWPAHSPMAAAVRVAAIAAFLAIAAALFTPEQSRQQATASRDTKALTTEDRAFIERSIKKHNNYSSSQPLGSTNVNKRGDVGSAESGDEESTEENLP